MAENKATLPPDVSRGFHDLRDKFKHGHHIIKILESQLETARQNISLLQGQVRLANETIDNLKQQFNEADMTLAYLTDNYKGNNEKKGERQSIRESDDYSRGPIYVARSEDHDIHRRTIEYDKHSPKAMPVLSKNHDVVISDADHTDRSKSPSGQHEKYVHEKPKSPYAQQLRQVLDALQDEDPRKVNQESHREVITSSQNQQQVCMCSDCVPSSTPIRHYQIEPVSSRGNSCRCEFTGTEVRYHEDCPKHMSKQPVRVCEEDTLHNSSSRNDVVQHDNLAVSHMTTVVQAPHQVDYSSQCTGPCCASLDLSKGYKVVEKSPGMPRYIAPRSPQHHKKHHEMRHDPNCQTVEHCDDNCRCHAFVNYAPFGYQLVESAPGIPQTIQPISPSISTSKKNKRYMPLMLNDEPPHLKYTKVKRIDGSKVAAQKIIQDFPKRRLQPYNPRWDLDLLIVPPPMPASELFTTLGFEQESSFQQSKDQTTAADSSFSNDGYPEDSNSSNFDNSLMKSKVINAGGTVIVLTENDQQPRSSLGSRVTPSQSPLMPSLANLPNPYTLLNQSTKDQSSQEVSKINSNSRLDSNNGPNVDDDVQMDDSHLYEDNADLKAQCFENQSSSNDEQSVKIRQSMTPETSPRFDKEAIQINNAVNYSSRQTGQANMSTTIVKKERNNNTSYSNLMVTHLSASQEEGFQDNSRDGAGLTSRYEKVLFQRNQDFGKLGADEEFILTTRSKGKVH